MTDNSSAASVVPGPAGAGSPAGSPRPATVAGSHRYGSWIPSWDLIATKHLELRKRRFLMVVVAVLTLGLPVIVLGLRLIFHVADPKSYGPAGSPAVFAALCNPMAEFGFIMAAVVGATAGTSDLTDGMFRHLVITGRSRLALYLARIPVGLSILLPLVAVAFTAVCLVTSFAGVPQPTSVDVDGISAPAHLGETQLESWLLAHPGQAALALATGPTPPTAAQTGPLVRAGINGIYGDYTSQEPGQLNPPVNEMVKIGSWIELEVGIGFMVGLGLGALIGQRTVPTVLLIVLEIIVTPLLAASVIPYFLNGQRLVVGIAMDQLRPAGLAGGVRGGGPGPGHALFGGRSVLGIPPMPTWAMITVIVGWIVGWSVIGAWRMATRDA